MVGVAQLVRASDCGSEGRGFEPHSPPKSRHIVGIFFKSKQESSITFLNDANQRKIDCFDV